MPKVTGVRVGADGIPVSASGPERLLCLAESPACASDLALGSLHSRRVLTSGWAAGSHEFSTIVTAEGQPHLLSGQAGGQSHFPLDLIT